MLLQDSWEDQVVCESMFMPLQMSLRLLKGSSLTQVKIKHNKPLAEADIILVYDGRQCYSAVGKTSHASLRYHHF